MHDAVRMTGISYWLAGVALLGVLHLGLLAALIAGLLIYELVEFGTRRLARIGIIPATGKVMLVVVLVLVIVAFFSLGIAGLAAQLSHGPESLTALLQKMADALDSARGHLPLWLQDYLPANIDEWQVATANWLRHNAEDFSVLGKEAGKLLVHILGGMIVGGIIALDLSPPSEAPLAKALCERADVLGRAFRNIVFSQVRISAINTLLTGIFILIVLPLTGNPLPLAKTMVLVTFLLGLLPIVGNLMSNSIIFLIGLSVSPATAVGALAFLVVIHKLEYFINAQIIGARIHARSWEILIAMLVMETAFGLSGLVAAPIYYAYLKDELGAKKLV